MDLADRYFDHFDLLAKALTRFDGLPDYVEPNTGNLVKKIAVAALLFVCLCPNVSCVARFHLMPKRAVWAEIGRFAPTVRTVERPIQPRRSRRRQTNRFELDSFAAKQYMRQS
jgi:hypothetical protein